MSAQAWLMVEDEGALLLALRKPDVEPFAGTWTLPGDAMHQAEHGPEAVERIGRDQLGVNVMGEELIDTLTLVEGGEPITVNLYRVGYTGRPRFRESGPYAQVVWVKVDELADATLPLPDALRRSLQAATGGDTA